ILWSKRAHSGPLHHGHAQNFGPLAIDQWEFYLDEPIELHANEFPVGGPAPALLHFRDMPNQPADFLKPGGAWKFTTVLSGGTAGPYLPIPLMPTEHVLWSYYAPTKHSPARVRVRRH